MRRLRVAVVAAACLATGGLVAGCSGSTAHARPGPSTRPDSPTPKAIATGTPADPHAVARLLDHGLATVRTAHLAMSTIASGRAVAGSGVLTQHRGTLTGLDVTEALPSGAGTLRVLVTGGTTYVMLPAVLVGPRTAHDWQVLPAGGHSALITMLRSVVDSFVDLASPGTLGRLAGVASGATDLGRASVGTTPTTHYRLVAAAAQVTRLLPGGVSAGGRHTVTLDLWLDHLGRPVRASATLDVEGQSLTPTVTLTDFDAPVTVHAPPADRIAG